MWKTTSKYHAKRTVVDGITFASMREAKRYQELKLLERARKIEHLRLQVPYVLIEKSEYGRAIKYVCDFEYYENGELVTEDSKGYRTDVFKLKKRMFEERYKRTIKET